MIRIGIIGAGNNATGHARYYAASERAELVAVADPVAAAREALAGETGARAFPDYTDFLDEVDAVVISSPNAFHREQCIACAEAGKHVYCEKPVGLSGDDARAMAEAAETAGVASTVGFAVYASPLVQTMHRLLREGVIGDPLSIWSRRLGYMDPATRAGWRKDPAQSGGVLLEINIHEIEWMMQLGGPVSSVFARTHGEGTDHPRANDHIWVTLDFAGTATGIHEGSWLSAMPNHFRGIHGTAGGAQSGEWGEPLYVARRGEDREEVTTDPALDLRAHFLDCVEEGVEPVCDLRWGERVMRVADAIFESAATGQPVTPGATEVLS